MKIIPLSEAKAHLSRYGKLCQQESVIVTVNGLPAFQLSPLPEEDDDLINQLLEHNPRFRAVLEARAGEPTISCAEAAKLL
jgi:antitoxin (DNA-binding transcriptional repressor) of toxin-antitoxin stability system